MVVVDTARNCKEVLYDMTFRRRFGGTGGGTCGTRTFGGTCRSCGSCGEKQGEKHGGKLSGHRSIYGGVDMDFYVVRSLHCSTQP